MAGLLGWGGGGLHAGPAAQDGEPCVLQVSTWETGSGQPEDGGGPRSSQGPPGWASWEAQRSVGKSFSNQSRPSAPGCGEAVEGGHRPGYRFTNTECPL